MNQNLPQVMGHAYVFPKCLKIRQTKRRNVMIYLLIGAFVCAADLWCKGKIDHTNPKIARMLHRLPRKYAGGRFQIDCVHNHGLAFNALDKYPVLSKILSASIFAAIAILGIPLLFAHGICSLTKLGLTLMLGGGASNVADRLGKGYVVDYLNIQTKPIKKLYINLGDISLLAGFLCLLLGSLLCRKK